MKRWEGAERNTRYITSALCKFCINEKCMCTIAVMQFYALYIKINKLNKSSDLNFPPEITWIVDLRRGQSWQLRQKCTPNKLKKSYKFPSLVDELNFHCADLLG